ncbi:insulin-like growth factor-binding protein 3 receptor [Brachionichthys hirsutus]|uniref:insulin-like growth factor-binding protein 3 receptor n=1 Tax=Brachionichthys hirsutus TaxID=412623 RepID=UPI003604D8B3
MGFWQPVTNIKDYISHNPPGVTFFLCLLTLAVTFICIGSYSYTRVLPNPDAANDWNRLLSSLSQLQLCENANASASELVSRDGDASVESNETRAFASLHLRVRLVATAALHGDSPKDLGLHATLRAKQLYIGGNEIINVTLEFLSGNGTYTCLTINAPTHLLPMSLLPQKCPASERNISSVYVEASSQPTASQTCYSLRSKTDPALTVMLTQEERNVAARHLLEVSMCLLGVCLGLCVAASLTQASTRRYHLNEPDLQNELLRHS